MHFKIAFIYFVRLLYKIICKNSKCTYRLTDGYVSTIYHMNSIIYPYKLYGSASILFYLTETTQNIFVYKIK